MPWKDLTPKDRVRAMAEWALEWAAAIVAASATPAQAAAETGLRLLLGEALAVLKANGLGKTDLAERIHTVLR